MTTVPPIFLGSAPSVGSTLVRVLLSRHPSIAGGGELGILDRPSLFRESPESFRKGILKWLRKGYPAPYLGSGNTLFRSLDGWPWDRTAVRRMCAEARSFPDMLQRFFSRTLEATGARRWMEKTPGNVYCFREIRSLYPDARFIHVIRDGRDAVVSYNRRARDPFLAVSRWYYATLTGIQYREWEKYCEVRYEDLVRDPAGELERICAFLDEPFLPELLRATGHAESKLSTWKSSPYSPVSAESIGTYRCEMDTLLASLFHRVRLTSYGISLLPFPQTGRAAPTPVELQEYLGYGTEGLGSDCRLGFLERRRAARTFRQWRIKQFKRYRVWPRCPTRIA